MKKVSFLIRLGFAGLIILALAAPSFAGGKIVVYSPWKDEIMRQFGEVFEKETGVKMESINISTGEIYARLKVEKARPQADIWHSVRAELLDKAREEGG